MPMRYIKSTHKTAHNK